MKNQSIYQGRFDFFVHYRTPISRVVGGVCLLLLMFTRTPVPGWAGEVLSQVGLLFVACAVLGRIWSSLYICGYKNRKIIDQGPYSVVRNPLYLFSFTGVLGLGLASVNFFFMGLVTLLFLGYYPLVILSEENRLFQGLGQDFTDYAARTPRFIPGWSRYQQPETYEVNVKTFTESFLDGIWFFAGYVGVEIVKAGHESGWLPVLWSLG